MVYLRIKTTSFHVRQFSSCQCIYFDVHNCFWFWCSMPLFFSGPHAFCNFFSIISKTNSSTPTTEIHFSLATTSHKFMKTIFKLKQFIYHLFTIYVQCRWRDYQLNLEFNMFDRQIKQSLFTTRWSAKRLCSLNGVHNFILV